MKRDRNQFTLGSLMILVATVGLLLSVPKANWIALWLWIPNMVAMLILGLVGFGITFIGSKLASGVGRSLGTASAEFREPQLEQQTRPSSQMTVEEIRP